MNERLKEIRKKIGLKLREMSDRLGVSISQIGQWESGAKEIPRARIYQICKEFNVRREWLENGSGDMFQSVDEQVAELLPKVSDKLLYREVARRLFLALKPEDQARALKFAKSLLDYSEKRTTDAPSIFEFIKNVFENWLKNDNLTKNN